MLLFWLLLPRWLLLLLLLRLLRVLLLLSLLLPLLLLLLLLLPLLNGRCTAAKRTGRAMRSEELHKETTPMMMVIIGINNLRNMHPQAPFRRRPIS